ncbi:MAG: hypothetical protein OXQ89_14075 [Rhodospirillaceae bacterium]|nr:hypothetical protein [Rhodospirillaceae bacterium]MDD9998865.1 hypothetical protein [Rhodospirillaceae bacterium]MDE0361145.1 hypothetical protein [Rhodospirillaceae bacterium]
MSAAIAFDTHRFVKNLTANGFTEAQAEALAHEQIHLFEANLATKSDIAAVKADLELKIEQVKSSLLKWMAGALTAHLAVVVAMIQFLVRTA